jgi:hypothetical protein
MCRQLLPPIRSLDSTGAVAIAHFWISATKRRLSSANNSTLKGHLQVAEKSGSRQHPNRRFERPNH